MTHFSWSHSSLGLFECPKKYMLLRHTKQVESPPSTAGDEGARLHELIEKYIRDDEWSHELLPWKRLLDIYKTKEGQCEVEYAFKWKDGELILCDPKDPDCWYIGYIDWLKIDGNKAEVVDWKTGRVKPSKQLQLYAWVVMMAHPEVDTVKCTFHWVNYNDQLSEWFTRNQLTEMFAPFQEKLDGITRCIESDVWPEVPGNYVKKTGRGQHCTYCPVTTEHCSEGAPNGNQTA